MSDQIIAAVIAQRIDDLDGRIADAKIAQVTLAVERDLAAAAGDDQLAAALDVQIDSRQRDIDILSAAAAKLVEIRDGKTGTITARVDEARRPTRPTPQPGGGTVKG